MEKKGKDSMSTPHFNRRSMLKMLGTGLGAAVLAGCAPKVVETVAPTSAPQVSVPPTEVPPTEVPPTAVPPTVAPTEAPKAISLRYQNHWTKETDAHFKGMEWLYKEFQAKNPGITIENILNPDSQESYKKITADCAAGDCPDIIHGPGPEMWDSGYLLDLKPYLDKDPAWKDLLIADTFFASGDHVWGLCGEFSPMPTIWNMRILEKAGVSAVPTTWDELLDVCDKVKKSGKTPTSWTVGGGHQWHDIIASQDGGLEALAENKFDAPQIKEAFTRLKVFIDNKWIPDNEMEITWQQSVALFVAEETAFYLNGAWTLNNEIRSEGAAPDLRDHVKFAPFPAVGARGTTVELKKTTAIGVAAKVADDPAKLDAAIKFMKFWFSAEGAKQWILLTQSPMGAKVDLSTIQGVDPLLLGFLGTKDQAKVAYALPGTQAMMERGWDDSWTGLQTLMMGKSADEAMTTFLNEMSKYK
jgi:ABC-type glycerol-3-phosphate transport system substrate-binding protein